MNDRPRDIAIIERLNRLIMDLKQWSDADLESLGLGRELEVFHSGKSSYPIKAYIDKSVPDSPLTVIIETWHRYGLGLSNRYFKGFVVKCSGDREDIGDDELWKYD